MRKTRRGLWYLAFVLDVLKKDRRPGWGILVCDGCQRPRICRKRTVSTGVYPDRKWESLYLCRRSWVKRDEADRRELEAIADSMRSWGALRT